MNAHRAVPSGAVPVVVVHGIFVPSLEMALLVRRLRRAGFDASAFGYHSVRASLDENADRLARALASCPIAPHVVGHSLGGVVALRALARNPGLDVGRVVCLGAPLAGSDVAARLVRTRIGRWALGATLREGVLRSPSADWAGTVLGQREVGVIAGTRAAGAGRLITALATPNDGTVTVRETELPGLRDHLCMRVSHTGLVLSSDVAREVARFLERGAFSREAS